MRRVVIDTQVKEVTLAGISPVNIYAFSSFGKLCIITRLPNTRYGPVVLNRTCSYWGRSEAADLKEAIRLVKRELQDGGYGCKNVYEFADFDEAYVAYKGGLLK